MTTTRTRTSFTQGGPAGDGGGDGGEGGERRKGRKRRRRRRRRKKESFGQRWTGHEHLTTDDKLVRGGG